MDWEYAFLYNLWRYIPGMLSLKIKLMWSLKSLWKVLKKWLQFFVWTLVYYSSLGFTNKQTSRMHLQIHYILLVIFKSFF